MAENQEKDYLGLEILATSPGGATLITTQRLSAALACTSGESCIKYIHQKYLSMFKIYKFAHILHLDHMQIDQKTGSQNKSNKYFVITK